VFVCLTEIRTSIIFRCHAPDCPYQQKIDNKALMVIKTTGKSTFKNKSTGKIETRNGTVFVHFLEVCLKNFLPGFSYDQVTIEKDTMDKLDGEAITYLRSFGIKM